MKKIGAFLKMWYRGAHLTVVERFVGAVIWVVATAAFCWVSYHYNLYWLTSAWLIGFVPFLMSESYEILAFREHIKKDKNWLNG